MASSTVATRLPQELMREIASYAKRGRMGPSEALRSVVGEWLAMTKYPAIQFRDGPAGRRPGLRGGPDVWEIAMVAREVGPSVPALCGHFAHVAPRDMEQALAYCAEHRDEVDAWVDMNLQVGEELQARHRRTGRSDAAARERIAQAVRSALADEPDVAFAYLFGSVLGRESFRDVDVGVYLRGGKADLERAAAMAQRLSERVGHAVDARVLNDAPVSFLYHVLRGQLVLSRDDELLGALIERTAREYLDAAPLLRRAAREAFAA